MSEGVKNLGQNGKELNTKNVEGKVLQIITSLKRKASTLHIQGCPLIPLYFRLVGPSPEQRFGFVFYPLTQRSLWKVNDI
jgi:hypothetical protein